MVHITVAYVPVAHDATYQVNQDDRLTLDFYRLTDGDIGRGDRDGGRRPEAQVTLSVGTPQHGTLRKNWDGRYIYRPNGDYAGADSFTYTVSDGTHTATGTLTINVQTDDDEDGCGEGSGFGDGWGGWNNSQSIVVNSGVSQNQGDNQGSSGYGYLVINQGNGRQDAAASSPPTLDWSAPYDNGIGASETTGDGWWSNLFSAPMLRESDLGQQCGLIVPRQEG